LKNSQNLSLRTNQDCSSFVQFSVVPSKPIKTLPNEPKPAKRSKEVKKVHALVRNYLNKPGNELANSSEN